MRIRTAFLLAFLLLFGLACNFSAQSDPTAPVPSATVWTPAPLPTTAVSTPTPQPTNTPAPTNTPLPTQRPAPNCTIRTDWPVYIVVPGDTLGTIAQRTGSSISQLVTANCLPNANLIVVGQALRVPRQPSPVVTPVFTPNPNPGPLVISPYQSYDGLTFFVRPFTTLYIAWPDAARFGSTQVEFLFRPEGSTTILSLGIDYDLSYDAAIQWTIPGNTRGQLYAVGRNLNSTVESPRARVETLESVPGQVQPLVIDPYKSFDGSTYRVGANNQVTLGWNDPLARTAARLEFFYYSSAYPAGLSLGVDPTVMDGATLIWAPPAGTNGQVTARVEMPDGSTFETPRVGIIAE